MNYGIKNWLLGVLLVGLSGAAYAASPTVATNLFVDDSDAQSGSQGDPVVDIDLTPVFSAVFNHPTGTETTTEAKFQVATDAAFSNTVWSQGWKTIASTAVGARSSDVTYSGSSLTTYTVYYWRVRFKDSQGNAGPWSTESASFRTVGHPTEATNLHVDSTNAQAASQGDPVINIDLSPVFSAVFNHQDPNASTTEVKFQVATDAAFTNTVWSQGYKTIASTSAGSRSPDVAYSGQSLASFNTYYWRVRFKDSAGNDSPWSTESASFRTVGHTQLATNLHVNSTDAQSGTQGNPVTGVDLSPVFSAIFNHQDTAATTTEVKFQVATDAGFTNTVWSQGWKTITSTAASTRSPDYAYGGQALTPATTYYWRIRFRDTFGHAGDWSTEAASFETAGGASNNPPVLDAIADGIVSEGREITIVVSALDPDSGQTLTYSADDGQSGPLPTGASFDPQTRTFTWRPDFDQAGVFEVRFTVEDDGSPALSDTQTIDVVVEDFDSAPSVLFVSNIDAQTGSEGTPVSGIGDQPLFSAVFNHSNSSASATETELQVSTDFTFATVSHWDAGALAVSSLAVGQRSQDIPYGGQPLAVGGVFYWRVRFMDSHGLTTDWSSKLSSFQSISFPSTPTGLFVASSNAQLGNGGNPVMDIDPNPVFSGVFEHSDSGRSAENFRIQVSTDPVFSTVTHWDSGISAMPAVSVGERTGNLDYLGATLQNGTTFYWRIKFFDDRFNDSPWSALPASFETYGSILFSVPNSVAAANRVTEIDLSQFTTGGAQSFYNYGIVAGPSWISVSDGVLTMTPNSADIGTSPHTVTLSASDVTGTVQDSIDITVIDPVPTAPSALVATAVDEEHIEWSWTDNSATESGFRVINALNGIVLYDLPPDTTSVVEDALEENTRYTRIVVAYGPHDDLSAPTSSVVGATLVKDLDPGDVEVLPESSTSVVFFLRVPTNAFTDMTGVFIERDVVPTFNTPDYFSTNGFIQEYSFRDETAMPSSTYYYRFTYRNVDGSVNTAFTTSSVQTPSADVLLKAYSGATQFAVPTGQTPEDLVAGVVDTDGNLVTAFGGTAVDFEIETPTAATFASNGLTSISVPVAPTGIANAGKIALNGETSTVYVTARATIGLIEWVANFMVRPTTEAVQLIPVSPSEIDGLITGGPTPGTLVGVTVRAVNADGAPLANRTISFRLLGPTTGERAEFNGTPDPKVASAITNVAGEATSPGLNLFGQITFNEDLFVEFANPDIGPVGTMLTVAGIGDPPIAGPVPMVLIPIGAEQERKLGRPYEPIGVKVLDPAGQPMAGVEVRIRGANVNAEAATQPSLTETYYVDNDLEERGFLDLSQRHYLPTQQFGVIGDALSVGPHVGHRMATLQDGRVVVVGGRDAAGGSLVSSFMVDLSMDCNVGSLPLLGLRDEHDAVVLPNGDLFVYGGTDALGAAAAAQLMDPVTLMVTTVANVPHRRQATVLVLGNGDLLVVGGTNQAGTPQNSLLHLQNIGSSFTLLAQVAFPDPLDERIYPAVAYDATADFAYVIGSANQSKDEVLTYDVANQSFASTFSLPSTSGGASFTPRSAIFLSGDLVVAGTEGAIIFSASGVEVARQETPLGSGPRVVLLPADPLNDAALARTLVVGGTTSLTGRHGTGPTTGFYPGPSFDDSLRGDGFEVSPMDNSYGFAVVVGGGLATSFESFTETRTTIFVADNVSDDPREPIGITNAHGEAYFTNLRTGARLGRETLRLEARAYDPLDRQTFTQSWIYINEYCVEPTRDCPAPGTFPSSSGGGGAPPGFGGILEEDEPEVNLPRNRNNHGVFPPLQWFPNEPIPDALCIGEICEFTIDLKADCGCPVPISEIQSPPDCEAAIWLEYDRSGAGATGAARLVSVTPVCPRGPNALITRYTVRIAGTRVSKNPLDVTIYFRALIDGIPQFRAEYQLDVTIVDLKLDICEPGTHDNNLFVAGQSFIRAELVAPDGIAMLTELEAMGNFALGITKFVLEANKERKIPVATAGVSAEKLQEEVRGYLYTWPRCHCATLNFTIFKLDIEVCDSTQKAEYPAFCKPNAGGVDNDWLVSGSSTTHAQFTPGKVTLSGPIGCKLEVTEVSYSGGGTAWLQYPPVNNPCNPEELAKKQIEVAKPVHFWIDTQDTEADCVVAQHKFKLCVGPVAAPPSPILVALNAPQPAAVTLSGGGGTWSATTTSSRKTEAGGGGGNDSEETQERECEKCVEALFTHVQVIAAICDAGDIQEADVVCAPPPGAMSTPFTYLLLNLVGPDGYSVPIEVDEYSQTGFVNIPNPTVSLVGSCKDPKSTSSTKQCDPPASIPGNTNFVKKILNPNTKVVKVEGVSASSVQDDVRLGIYTDCTFDDDCLATTTEGAASRDDLGTRAGKLMVGHEALTCIEVEIKPCDTVDTSDDVTVVDGVAPVVVEISPASVVLDEVVVRTLDEDRVLVTPSPSSSTGAMEIEISGSGAVVGALGVSPSVASKDARLVVVPRCKTDLSLCDGEPGPQLQESPICAFADLTVFKVEGELPEFICVNESLQGAAKFKLSAPSGTPFPSAGIELDVTVTSSMASYTLTPSSHNFTAWNTDMLSDVMTGSQASGGVDDISLTYGITVLPACFFEREGPTTTVYKLDGNLKPKCVLVGEGFDPNDSSVTGNFTIMPDLPPNYQGVQLTDLSVVLTGSAQGFDDPGLRTSPTITDANVGNKDVDVKGFGIRDVKVEVLVDGVAYECGASSTQIQFGGLPDGVPHETVGPSGMETIEFTNEFSLFGGTTTDLPLREVPLGIGSFSTSGGGGTVSTTSNAVRLSSDTAGGPHTFETRLQLGSSVCSAPFTVAFLTNQGPDCGWCKPAQIGPILNSPSTSGTAAGDTQDSADPVQLDRGDVSITRLDLLIPGRGFSFAHVRTYRGMSEENSAQGRKWGFAYDFRLDVQTNGDLTLIEGDKSRAEVYASVDGLRFATPVQHFTELVKLGTSYRLLQRNGMAVYFDSNGIMVSREDPHGNKMEFLYEDTGNPDRLTAVIDTMGRRIEYAYYPNTDTVIERRGRIHTITDFFGRQVIYNYDNQGNLISARSPAVTGTSNGNDFANGKSETYNYYDVPANPRVHGKLFQIIQPNENEPRTGFGSSFGISLGTPTFEYAYYADGAAQTVTWGGTGQSIQYDYAAVFLPETDQRNAVTRRTTVTDRNGNVTEYYFSALGQIVEVRELTKGLRAGEPDAFVTQWKFNDHNQMVRVTRPEGDATEYTYDDGLVSYGSAVALDCRLQSNILEIKRLPGPRAADQNELITRFVIEPIYNKPCVIIDPRGHESSNNLRYASRAYFDWEEADNRDQLAEYLVPHLDSTPNTGAGWQYVTALIDRMKARGMSLGIGATDNVPSVGIAVGSDMNGDGVTTSTAGNVVRSLAPKVTLTAEQAAILGSGADQYVSSGTLYNRFGQPTGMIDASGNLSAFVYNPTANPSGGGSTGGEVVRDDGSVSGGYLNQIHSDIDASSAGTLIKVGRDIGGGVFDDQNLGAFTSPIQRDATQGTHTAINAQTTNDLVGNVTSTTDPRGAVTTFEVNELNQVVKVTAPTPYSYSTDVFYDANNNVVRTTIENAEVQVDGNGRLQLTPSGSSNQFLNAALTAGTPPTFVHRYKYDLLNDLRETDIDAIQPNGTPTRLVSNFGYDNNQNLISITQPDSNVVRLVLDERDLMFTSTRGFGSADASTVQFDYDGNRSLVRLHDGTGDITDSVYDGFNRLKQITDAEGNDLILTYDPVSNVLSSLLRGPVDGQSTSNVDLVRSFTTYDELSRPFESKQDIFDENQQAVASGGPGASETFVKSLSAYDNSSRLRGVIEDDGALNTATSATSAFNYDGLHRLKQTIDVLGNTNTYEYDNASNLTKSVALHLATDGVTNAETYTTTYFYDVMNRLTRVIDNVNNNSEYAYDSRGNLTHSTDALQNTSVSVFDGASRLVETIRDMRGTAAQITDDEINTIYTYDLNSRLDTIEDDNGNVTDYGYDELDRLKTTTYANAGVVTLTYDADDNVITTTDQNGTLVTNAYDSINRLTSRTATLPGPVTTRASGTTSIVGSTIQTFEYDGANRLTLATDNNDLADSTDDTTCEYIYDSLSRVTSETQTYNSTPYTVGYDYVSDNRLSQLDYPAGNQLDYTYDDLDRVTGIDWTTTSQHNASNSAGDAELNYIGPGRTLTRNVLGKVTRDFHDPNDGTGATSGYDGLGRPVFLDYGNGTLTFGYDAVSNETFEHDTQTLGGGNDARNFESYLYDAAYRLSDFKTGVAASAPTIPTSTTQTGDTRLNGQLATNPGFNMQPFARDLNWALDGVGNWKGFTENGTAHANSVDTINQYTQFKGVSLDNAPNGNMVVDLPWGGSGTGSAGTDQLEYEYDAFDRLRRVFFFDTGTSSEVTVGGYDYDAMGRRVFRSADEDHDLSLETNIRYVCSGDRVIEERSSTGNLLREYVYGNYIDEPIWMRDTSSTRDTDEFIFGQDENFNVYALFNLDSNLLSFATVEQYRYDAYGEFTIYDAAGNITGTATSGSKPLSPYVYQGRRWDVESGLYCFRARYMNPRLGRFLSFDPLGYRDGMGLYAFTGSGPIRRVDPYGEGFWEGASFVGMAMVGGAVGFIAAPVLGTVALGVLIAAEIVYYGTALVDAVGLGSDYSRELNKVAASVGTSVAMGFVDLITGWDDWWNAVSDKYNEGGCGNAAEAGWMFGFRLGAVGRGLRDVAVWLRGGKGGGATGKSDAPPKPTESAPRNDVNWKGDPVKSPEGHTFGPRDPAMSEPPIVERGPFTEAQKNSFLEGKGGDTNLSPHHRHQLPVRDGGVIDEVPGPGHPAGNSHTGGSPTRHPNRSIFNREEGGNALRAREIREHWKAKGRRLEQGEDGYYYDPGQGK